MSIRDRIRSLPYGKKKALQIKADVSRQTLWEYQEGLGKSVATAQAIATALSCPSKWPEFFPKAQKPSPVESSTGEE